MLSFLVLSWSLSFGYVPTMLDAVGVKTAEIDKQEINTYAAIGLSLTAWDRLTLSTSINNYQTYNPDSKLFNPFRVDYKAGIEFRILDGMTLEINHECDHTVLSSFTKPIYYPYGKSQTIMSVTFSGTSK